MTPHADRRGLTRREVLATGLGAAGLAATGMLLTGRPAVVRPTGATGASEGDYGWVDEKLVLTGRILLPGFVDEMGGWGRSRLQPTSPQCLGLGAVPSRHRPQPPGATKRTWSDPSFSLCQFQVFFSPPRGPWETHPGQLAGPRMHEDAQPSRGPIHLADSERLGVHARSVKIGRVRLDFDPEPLGAGGRGLLAALIVTAPPEGFKSSASAVRVTLD